MIHALRVETLEQLQSCLEVRRKVFIEEQNVPEELEIDELDVPTTTPHLLLLEDGSVPVGTARLKSLDETTAKIQRVAVLPSHRGTGLGRRVMQEVESLARAEGYQRLVLDSQCHAKGFYERLGYEVLDDTIFLDAGIEHVKMGKELS